MTGANRMKTGRIEGSPVEPGNPSMTENSSSQSPARRAGRVAVLIPVYNAACKLRRTLESIYMQDGDFDVFVVDDGSVPPLHLDTEDFRQSPRVIRLSKNLGIVAALNTGLKEILDGPYDYVARQDAGDRDVGNRLAEQAAYLDDNPEAAIVGSWAQFVGPGGEPAFLARTPDDEAGIWRRMRYGYAFIHPAVMMRADALRKVGLYDGDYPCAEDYELFFRLMRAYSGTNLQRALVITEVNPKGISMDRRRAQLLSRMKVQMTYFSFHSIYAYLGLARSLLFYCLPYGALLWLKQKRKVVN